MKDAHCFIRKRRCQKRLSVGHAVPASPRTTMDVFSTWQSWTSGDIASADLSCAQSGEKCTQNIQKRRCAHSTSETAQLLNAGHMRSAGKRKIRRFCASPFAICLRLPAKIAAANCTGQTFPSGNEVGSQRRNWFPPRLTPAFALLALGCKRAQGRFAALQQLRIGSQMAVDI